MLHAVQKGHERVAGVSEEIERPVTTVRYVVAGEQLLLTRVGTATLHLDVKFAISKAIKIS